MKALVTVEDPTASVQDIPVPSPGEGEILVKVHYVAQNPTDWKTMTKAPAGRILGCDFAGTVANANGSRWREGQRVAGFVRGTEVEPPRGAFAEYAVVEDSLVFAVPDGVLFQDAAVVPLAFATAAQMIQRLGLPEPSSPATSSFPVLVNGGSSSVGLYAVQLLKLAGLFVIATASKANHKLLTDVGADAVVDYRDADWTAQVRKLSGDGLQYALDTISEVETTKAVVEALSPTKGGHVICILPRKAAELGVEGSATIKIETTIAYSVFGRSLPKAYQAFDNSDASPEDKAFWEKYLRLLPELLESGKIKPNPVRELGGIEDILTGFKLQEEGKVRAEKLVYKIA